MTKCSGEGDSNFFWHKGLLLQRWCQVSKSRESDVEQMICRREVMRLAHTILMKEVGEEEDEEEILA